MVETLRKIMPHTAVIREVYGIDVWKNLAEYRNKISEKTTLAEFCGLAVRALTSCNGHHLFPSDGSALKNSVLRERYKDILSDEDIQAGNNMAMILMTSLDVFKRLNGYNLPLQKRDVQYYTAAEIVGFGETIPESSTLLTVNGIPAAEAESQEAFSQENRFKLSFLQVPLSQSGVEELQFKTPDERLVTMTVDSTRSDFSRNLLLPGKTIPKMVQYWPELETIYVRIPRMTPADIHWYLEEIDRVLDGKTAQTAIIDIRYNPGGSDAVGTQVASKLSAKEIQCNLAFAFKTDPSIVDYVTQSGISLEETELKTIDFLDNEPYYVITSESVIPGQGSAESLYILTDEICSAAGTLTMIAGENDHMHTLGLKTEKLVGGGIAPYLFQLPNSKLFISVEPIIDITNCRTATDVMHNQVDIPLELSEEAWGQYLVTPVPADNPEALKHYLIEKDPFVQEALRQAGKLTQETIQ